MWSTFLLIGALVRPACAEPPAREFPEPPPAREFPVTKPDAQWRTELSAEEYRILREAGTERAFTGKYWDQHEHGVYRCAGCGQIVFRSDDKFDSGTGWPSYTRPAEASAVVTEVDRTLGMVRTEVLCGRCGGHLGHVFDDGPRPTGERWCINGNALDFEPTPKEAP